MVRTYIDLHYQYVYNTHKSDLIIYNSCTYLRTYVYVARRMPTVKVDAIIHIDVDFKEVSKMTRESISGLLTKKEFTASVSLVRAENKTFLETRYWRYYPSEFVNGTAYDQLEIFAKGQEILAKAQESDYSMLRRAFVSFICVGAAGNDASEIAEVTTDDGVIEACFTPPNESWNVKLHTSHLSTAEYTPLQVLVRGFKVTLSYIQDCGGILKTCENVENALIE